MRARAQVLLDTAPPAGARAGTREWFKRVRLRSLGGASLDAVFLSTHGTPPPGECLGPCASFTQTWVSASSPLQECGRAHAITPHLCNTLWSDTKPEANREG